MITILFVALVGACIGMVGYYSNQSTVSSYNNVVKESSPKLFLLSRIANQANRIQVETLSYVMLSVFHEHLEQGDASELVAEEAQEMQEATDQLLELLKDLEALDCQSCIKEDEQLLLSEIEAASKLFIYLCTNMIAAVERGESKAVLSNQKKEIEELEEVLLTKISKEIDREHFLLNRRMEAAVKTAHDSNSLILMITALGVFIAIVMGVFLSNSIVKPILKLKDFAFSVGKGHLDQKIEIRSKDEIGSLSESFQNMTNDLRYTLDEKTKLVKLAGEAENEKIRIEELQKINKELEQFAYISSHDLKAPLVNIYSIITMIEMQGGATKEVNILIDKIKNSVNGMRHKIAKLSEVIKHKKNLKIEPETVSFSNHVKKVSKSLETQILESEAEINTDFSGCDSVYFPSLHLDNILTNLISNSIKYRKPKVKPIINLATSCSKDWVYLTVKDNGLGIDLKAYGSKLFSLFQRFHLEIEGDGVGLHMVKNIVESYGGKIEVESKPNEGTIFKIHLKRLI